MPGLDLDKIVERCESAAFKQTNQEIADTLWDVINEAINDRAEERSDGDNVWERYYRPAMRHGILRRLAEMCSAGEEGWYTVFCNHLREDSERG